MSTVLAKVRQIKSFLPVDARIKFCYAFMFPHLDYCSCVWGIAQLERLFKLQKRAARMIYNLPTRTPTGPLLKQLNWMPLMDRIKYKKAVMVFKSLNGLAPQYMKNLFQFVGEVSCRSTRNYDKTKLYLAPGSHLQTTLNFQLLKPGINYQPV